MTNAILIGEHIYATLSNSEELHEYVGNKIYPLVAENTTTYPFLLYYRDTIETISHTKDGYCQDAVTFTIIIVDTNYTKTIYIANCVRRLMEAMNQRTEEISIFDTHMISIDETFVENAYVQTLTFQCKVEN